MYHLTEAGNGGEVYLLFMCESGGLVYSVYTIVSQRIEINQLVLEIERTERKYVLYPLHDSLRTVNPEKNSFKRTIS
jgi:hypothetical protein